MVRLQSTYCIMLVLMMACCSSGITARKLLGQQKTQLEVDDDQKLAELQSGSKELEKGMLAGLVQAYQRSGEPSTDQKGVTVKQVVAAPAAEAQSSLQQEFEQNEGEVDDRLHSLKHVSYKWKQPPSTPL